MPLLHFVLISLLYAVHGNPGSYCLQNLINIPQLSFKALIPHAHDLQVYLQVFSDNAKTTRAPKSIILR